jgi:hypothetical protein
VQSTAPPPPGRRLALFDLDGTLTRHDTYFPFVLGLLASMTRSKFVVAMVRHLNVGTKWWNCAG